MMDGAGRMKQIGAALAEADRKKAKRQWHWCRRANGFSDMPLWKLVARRAKTSTCNVLAFVNRLEELANSNGNIEGRERGSLEGFDAEEFSIALEIPAEETTRIFAALEDDKAGWIWSGHLATFYDRNKDVEEDALSVRDRKRRSRSYRRIREQLARLARLGKITSDQRVSIEVTLRGIGDAELATLQNDLARAELSTDTRSLWSHRSQSDRVTVTAEETTNLEQTKLSAVDNSGDGDCGESAGLPKGAGGDSGEEAETATLWIDTEGKKLLVEYLNILLPRAETLVERWRRDLQDDVALRSFMLAADLKADSGARFHVLIVDQLQRFLRQRANGAPLPLMPPRPGTRTTPEAATDGHEVTSAAVDNLKRNAS